MGKHYLTDYQFQLVTWLQSREGKEAMDNPDKTGALTLAWMAGHCQGQINTINQIRENFEEAVIAPYLTGN